MSLYDDLSKSLNIALEYAKGNSSNVRVDCIYMYTNYAESLLRYSKVKRTDNLKNEEFIKKQDF